MIPAAQTSLSKWLTDSGTSWRIPAFLGAFLAMLSFWALRGAFTRSDFGIVVATGALFALGFTFSAQRQRFTHQSLLITALFFLIIHPGFTPGVGFGTLLLYVAILQILQGTNAERTVRNFLTIACIASIYVIRLVRVGMVDFNWVEGGISLSLVLLTLWMIASRSHAWQAEREALIQDLEVSMEAVAEPQEAHSTAAARLQQIHVLQACHAPALSAVNRTSVFGVLHERFATGSMTWHRLDQPLLPLDSLQAFAEIIAQTSDPMELIWDVQAAKNSDTISVSMQAPEWKDSLKTAAYAQLAPPPLEVADNVWQQYLVSQAVQAMVQQGWETRISGNTLTLHYHVGHSSNTPNRSASNHRQLFNPEFARKFPMRILVAEDNPVNQKLVVFMLEKLGYELTLAENGVEAVEHCKQRTFDLIFMDLHMPQLDGIEASREILKVHPEMCIVPLTANVSDESKAACNEAGMRGFIAKPFAIGQLAAAIQDAFANRPGKAC